jgi:predicted RNase H-like HicB family nuclease
MKVGTLSGIVKQAGLTMSEFVALLLGADMQFTVLVHEDEDGGYWGECLELPGCISQGDTLDQMDSNIREAIELVLEVKLEDGEDLLRLEPREPVLADDPDVRRWIINLPLPQLSSV